jgi:hypothetical protein
VSLRPQRSNLGDHWTDTKSAPLGGFHVFFRRRFALVVARLCQGARTAVIDDRPPLDASLDPDSVTAAAFSRTMRQYSAGEHLSRTISSVRRIIVSQDANISSVITNRSDDFRRLLAFILNVAFRDSVYGASGAGAVISVVAKSPGMMISMNFMSSDQS